jgi:hypothetical protein
VVRLLRKPRPRMRTIPGSIRLAIGTSRQVLMVGEWGTLFPVLRCPARLFATASEGSAPARGVGHRWRAVAFSVGGDGGRKAPEHPALHVVCGSQRLPRCRRAHERGCRARSECRGCGLCTPTHDYEPTREAAMAAFANSGGGSSAVEADDRGGSNQHPALLERQDCTLVTWYRSLTHLAREGRMTVTIGRREVLAALGGAAAVWPLSARR